MRKGTKAEVISDAALELQEHIERLDRRIEEALARRDRAEGELEREQNRVPRFAVFVLGFFAGVGGFFALGFLITHCTWR